MACRSKIVLAVLLSAFPLAGMSLPKTNEFTRANSSFGKSASFDKKYEKETSSLQDKMFGRKIFQGNTEKASVQNEKFHMPDDESAKRFGDSNHYKEDKDFKDPGRYDRTDKKYDKNEKKYRDNEKKSPDRTTRDYMGDFEWHNRNVAMQKSIDDYYKAMEERSVQDINKYFFREGRSNEGAKTVRAGEEIYGEDDGSFWDFLTGKKNLERNSVSLKGGRKTKSSKPQAEGNKDSSGKYSESGEKEPVKTFEISPTKVNAYSERSENTKEKSSPSNSKKRQIAVQKIDREQAKGFNFLSVPENVRGEAVIKVEVKEND